MLRLARRERGRGPRKSDRAMWRARRRPLALVARAAPAREHQAAVPVRHRGRQHRAHAGHAHHRPDRQAHPHAGRRHRRRGDIDYSDGVYNSAPATVDL